MQKQRIFIALIILILLIGGVLGIDYFQRRGVESKASVDAPAGSIPIYVDGQFTASFIPTDLEVLELVSFVDAEEGKTQEGWLLSDVIKIYIATGDLEPETEITVTSSSRDKSVTLSWSKVDDLDNMVMFDLSGRGTLKLVSTMQGFDTRDDWVLDVDRIEIAIEIAAP